MPDRTIPIAPVRLARSGGRLAAPTLILLGTAGVAAAAAFTLDRPVGIVLLTAAVVVAVLALYLLIMLLTVRLDVEVASLHLRWAGGERRYALTRGPVTRVAVRGEGSAAVRPRFGALGWGLGPARLRGQERIELVRLAPTETVILVPTDRGRLALAPASEAELIAALTAAARVQQRLDDAIARTRAIPAPERPTPEEPAPEAAADMTPLTAVPLPEGRLLTGIERQALEERLAAERAAALAAAEAERAAAAAAAAATVSHPLEAADTPPAVAEEPVVAERRLRRRPTWRAPTWLRPESLPRPDAVGVAVAAAPLVTAGVALATGLLTGTIAGSAAELRPLWLALALAGPGGTLGALMARAWFPRQAGLVVVTAVLACVLIGRAALG